MGNQATTLESFAALGIPQRSQSYFKRSVLDHFGLDSVYGNDLTSADPSSRKEIAANYLQSGRLQKFQQQNSTSNAGQDLTEDQSLKWLLRLIDVWLEEKKRQESQEDPPYSETLSSGESSGKKRKRPSEQASQQETSFKSPNKKSNQAQTATIASMWATKKPPPTFSTTPNEKITNTSTQTMQENSQETQQDTSQRTTATTDEDEDDDLDQMFPHPSQILAERSPTLAREFVIPDEAPALVAARKGKAPVRDPPVSSPTLTRSFTIPGTGISKDNNNASTTPTDSNTIALPGYQSEPSPRSTGSPQPETRLRRSYRSMVDLEASIETSNLNHHNNTISPTISKLPSHDVPDTSQTHSLPTPPPTVQQRRSTLAEPKDRIYHRVPLPPPIYLQTQNQTETQESQTHADDIDDSQRTQTPSPSPTSTTHPHPAWPLAHSIITHIQDCLSHSLGVIHDPSSSDRERQIHQVRAAVYANMKADVESRIIAFARGSSDSRDIDVERDEGDGDVKVTSFCLWS